MKTVNKIIVAMLLIVTVKSTAFASNINIELVNKMAESKNVKLFLEQRVKSLFNRYGEGFSSSEIDKMNFRNDCEKQFSASLETKKLIENEFPELTTLNDNEKKEVFELLLKTPYIASRVSDAIKCMGKVLLSAVTCQFGAMTVFQTWFWGACMYSAVAADIAATVAVVGAAPALPVLVIAEAGGCWAVATASTTAIAVEGIGINCVTGSSLLACILF